MNNQFLTYQKFGDKSLANELLETLKAHQIDCIFEDASPHFDHSFANNQLDNIYLIKIKNTDFEKADNVLTALAAKDLHLAEPDYYLFDFTDDELKEVLLKSDEWSNMIIC